MTRRDVSIYGGKVYLNGVLHDGLRADHDLSSDEWRLFENGFDLGKWKTFDEMLSAIRERYLTESVE